MRLLPQALDRISLALAVVAGAGLALLALLTFLDVVGRYLFNSPLPFAVELVEWLVAVAVMGALPMTGFVRGHVSVDLLENVAGAAGKAALSAISMASTLAFALLVAWQLVLRALDQAGEGLLTPILGWPTWPVIAFAAAAATVAVLVQVALLLGADAREAASGDWD